MPKTKVCTTCRKRRSIKKFYKHPKGKFGRLSDCKECHRTKVLKRYRSHKERFKRGMRRYINTRRDKIRRMLILYLLRHPCVDCGEDDPIVLEFDHVRGKKESGIAGMLHRACKTGLIRREMKKCVVRCANCHRRKTAVQFDWPKRKILAEFG